ATPIIIERLKKQGYRFVTIPELLKIGAQKTVCR
ncbi:MAG TPA: polysaccharide deacetylase family protein, partial [Firmicutes bacterium]|nr:polysaccharide deacetylase family protein [Bacillota bacterium]